MKQLALACALSMAGCFWSDPGIHCDTDNQCPTDLPACDTSSHRCGNLYKLSVNTTGDGAGTISGPGINCGSACSANFSPGVAVLLNAVPNGGSRFLGWGDPSAPSPAGSPCTGTGPCTVTMNGNINVSADFTHASAGNPTLSVTVSGPGIVTSDPAGISCGSGTCSASFAAGTSVTLTGNAGTAQFSGWGGACSGTGGCVVSMNTDQSVSATFGSAATQETLSVTVAGAGSGSVTGSVGALYCTTGNTCSVQADSGATATLTATASPGSTFAGFSGACTGSSCSLSMTGPLSVTATFIRTPNRLTVTVTGPGSVDSTPAGISGCAASSGTCSASFSDGVAITLAYTAASNSSFGNWSGACSGSGVCSVNLNGMDETVGAAFNGTSLVTVVPAGGGSGSVVSSPAGIDCPATSCSARFAQNQGVSLTATAGASASFVGFTGDCSGSSCYLGNPTVDRTVTATFVRLYTLSMAMTGCGYITSSPTGVACYSSGGSGCSPQFAAGTSVALSPSAPCSNNVFEGFGGDCGSAASTCTLVMSQDRSATAAYSGFSVSSNAPSTFSMIQGESRTLDVTVTRASPGAPISVGLSFDSLPAGVTASFSPSTVAATGHSTLTLTAAANATLGSGAHYITGTYSTLTGTSYLNLEVRSPMFVESPYGLALESDSTALVAEKGGGRISRVDVVTKKVLNTVADVPSIVGLALEGSGTSALATTFTGSASALVRVTLATGAVATLATALVSPRDIAVVSTSTALVTDCGSGCYSSATGRLVSVDLGSGNVSPIATNLAGPSGIAIEASGKVLVAETQGGRLLEVSPGSVVQIAAGLSSPTGVFIEPGGASALVAEYYGRILRVTLATGTVTPFAATPSQWGMGDIALLSNGYTLLAAWTTAGGAAGTVLSFDTRWPVSTLAPSAQQAGALQTPTTVTAEAGGTMALVADCGGGCFGGSSTGRLLEVTLATGAVRTIVANGLQSPEAIAIVGDGTALVTEEGGGRLTRVTLGTGTFNSPVGGLTGAPWGVAIKDANTVLISQLNGRVMQSDLTSGTSTLVGTGVYGTQNIALESSGKVLVTTATYSEALFEFLPNGGTITDNLAPGIGDPIGLSLEASGTAIVTENTPGRVSRVDLATGNSTVLATTNPKLNDDTSLGGISVEPGGLSALAVVNGTVVRVTFGTTYTPKTIARGNSTGVNQSALQIPEGAPVAIEASGTVLYADCGGNPSPSTPTLCGRVLRASLSGGTPVVLATGFNVIGGIAALDANTALVTDCGPTVNKCTAGRLFSVSLAGGATATASTIILPNMNVPLAIAIEPNGANPPVKALIAEQGAGRVLEVTLATSGESAPGTSLTGVNQVAVEAGGATALVATQAGLERLDLTTGVATLISSWNVQAFAIEPGGVSVLAAGAGAGLPASLARINVTTGGVDVLRGGLFNGVGSFALDLAADASGKTAVFSEPLTNSRGSIYLLGL